MDRKQEDMQFLGLFGIFQEAYKIIFSWRKKLFTQIILTLILPLSFINLAHTEISKLLFPNINIHNQISSDEATPKYNNQLSDFSITFWLFEAAYLTFALIFSLLSIAAVVYTIACSYTGREVTFDKVVSVVPKIWKRLMLTFLSTFAAFFAYSIVAVILTLIFITVVYFVSTNFVNNVVPVLIVLGILFAAGSVYMVIVLQLANVVTVLEDAHGFHALSKSKALIKGKMGVSTIIVLMFNISGWLIQVAFQKHVVDGGESLGLVNRVAIGIICLLLLLKLILFGLAIQTVLYRVCKSYHHENIDKSALSDHLEAYPGEYVPLKTKDVQFEEFNV